MIVELRSADDLVALEDCLCQLIGSLRPDISLLKSMAYIKFKLSCLKGRIQRNESVYFSHENVWIKVLEIQPVIVLYCGLKELDYDNIKFMKDSSLECGQV